MSETKGSPFSINTILGAGTEIQGNIAAAGFTRIDGALRGDLRVQGPIVIGEQARLLSNVEGTSITIGGVIKGDIVAPEGVIVLSTGIVIGTIITSSIRADDGCLIHGEIITCRTKEEWDTKYNRYKDTVFLKHRF